MSPLAPVGRFAPSPTGDLHLGSMLVAVASYLDVKAQGGRWLVRMEDLDPPRVVRGAADRILTVLESFGLHWDGGIVYQSRRQAAYLAALAQLQDRGVLYRCGCSRKGLAGAPAGRDGTPRYPGTCRGGMAAGPLAGAWRIRVPDRSDGFQDRLQGAFGYNLAADYGDFVVQRADGVFAYQLAVVTDDAEAGVTDVVRGRDLLHSTPRQLLLQELLGMVRPRYLHLPLLVNAQGEKLSKQTLAQPVAPSTAPVVLSRVLALLGQPLPLELAGAPVAEQLSWALLHWRTTDLPRVPFITIEEFS